MSGERRSTRPCAAEAARTRAPAPKASRPAANARAASLHVGIIRPSSAFGDDPVDVLGRVLDVARLAVDAILGVDLKPGAGRLLDEFVDSSRAISLLGPVVERQIDLGRDRRILEGQMDRLVLLVVGVGDE